MKWNSPGIFFFQAEDGIRDLVRSRGLGDVYKRQVRAVHQIQMQIRNLVPEMEHEFLHVFLLSFSSDKLLPSFT